MEVVASQIAVAVNVRSLYPAQHPRVAQSVEELAGAIAKALAPSGGEEITFILIGNDLVVGDQIVRTSGVRSRRRVRPSSAGTAHRTADPGGGRRDRRAPPVHRRPRHGRGARLHAPHHPRAREGPHDEDPGGAERHMLSPSSSRSRARRGRVSGSSVVCRSSSSRSWSGASRTRSRGRPGPCCRRLPLKTHDEYTFVHSVNVSLSGPGPGALVRLRGSAAPRHRRGGAAARHRQAPHPARRPEQGRASSPATSGGSWRATRSWRLGARRAGEQRAPLDPGRLRAPPPVRRRAELPGRSASRRRRPWRAS